MKHVPEDIRNTIGKALGRIPSGIYILTARHETRATAMLASWVQQAAFDPPAISIAIAREREIAHLIRASQQLAISILPETDTTLMKRYARGVKDGEDAFATMRITNTPQGLPVFTESLAWLDCRVLQTCEFNADHDLIIAQVTAGQLLKEGPAFTHQRGSGFHY